MSGLQGPGVKVSVKATAMLPRLSTIVSQPHMMRTILSLILVMVGIGGFAQEPTPPTVCILPEDVAQDSIQQLPFGTNSFVVRWTYTEAGAKKMLAFRKAHDGQEVIIRAGRFEFRGGIKPRDSYPPGWVNDEGWLKRRTDKFFGVSETDAKKIVEGLKGK